jgi:hypothetical protein
MTSFNLDSELTMSCVELPFSERCHCSESKTRETIAIEFHIERRRKIITPSLPPYSDIEFTKWANTMRFIFYSFLYVILNNLQITD